MQDKCNIDGVDIASEGKLSDRFFEALFPRGRPTKEVAELLLADLGYSCNEPAAADRSSTPEKSGNKLRQG